MLSYGWTQRQLLRVLSIISGGVCCILLTGLVLALGFQLHQYLVLIDYVVPYVVMYVISERILAWVLASFYWRELVRRVSDSLVMVPLVSWVAPTYSISPSLTYLALIGVIMGRLPDIKQLINLIRFRPGQLIVMAFLTAIVIGSTLLSLPLASATNQSIPIVDAIFTATSAICVTGLVVNDISTEFSRFGQSIILLLVQVGGLGIMAFSAFLSLILQRKMSQSHVQFLQEGVSAEGKESAFKTLKSIFKVTLIVECIGAVLLTSVWFWQSGQWSDSLYFGVFHSISAFCNAGFSLFSNGLIDYATSWPVAIIIGALIVLGGIGFPVLYNILQVISKRDHVFLKSHTKIVLWASLGLLLIGTSLILALEYNNALAHLDWPAKIMNAFFQSITTRTAGFSTIDISTCQSSTLVLMMALMYIGAAPGSTGGGIRVTTVSIMIGTLFQIMTGRTELNFFKRKVPVVTQNRALAIGMISLIVVGMFLFLMLQIETISFLPAVFEVISAFGTVGLSLNVTPSLSIAGKVLIMILMFIGRIGALSLTFAIARQSKLGDYHYPEERVPLV